MTDANYKRLTGTSCPRLVLVHPELDGDHMTLTASGMPDIRISLPEQYSKPLIAVKTNHQAVDICDVGDEVAKWLSEVLQIDGIRMVFYLDTVNNHKRVLQSKQYENMVDYAPDVICSSRSVDNYLTPFLAGLLRHLKRAAVDRCFHHGIKQDDEECGLSGEFLTFSAKHLHQGRSRRRTFR